MKYTLSYHLPERHYLDIRFEIDNIEPGVVELQFPAWRPGRYELGNFAKNIQKFKVYDGNGQALPYQKTSKDVWEVEANDTGQIVVEYNYYAFELNAGSTYLDDQQLYVNPVNCFMYAKGRQDEACELELKIPEDYQVACGHPVEGNRMQFNDYHQLVDSPFIASASLLHHQFEVSGIDFHLWFLGDLEPDWEGLVRDFKGYTRAQLDAFGSFPVKEYHYLFQVPAYQVYHGVEHQASTVIALGPSDQVFGELYSELLGVSSHELYHTWNVKALRPADMFPYDYSKENYSKLGYVCEGVTTYLGDLFLLRGKVFTIEEYLNELDKQLKKHFDNPGRLNMSVADSSFDTWLDGYVPGVPGRKVSIYTEGCLLAFVLDTILMRETGNQASIHDLMRNLYEKYACQNKSYSEEDYRREAEKLAGCDLGDYFESYVYGTSTLEGLLQEALDYVGLKLVVEENEKFTERVLGARLVQSEIRAIAEGSPAEMCGLSVKDKVISVNGTLLEEEIDKSLEAVLDQDLTLEVDRRGRLLSKVIPNAEITFWKKYKAVKLEEPSRAQREAFNKWSAKKS